MLLCLCKENELILNFNTDFSGQLYANPPLFASLSHAKKDKSATTEHFLKNIL